MALPTFGVYGNSATSDNAMRECYYMLVQLVEFVIRLKALQEGTTVNSGCACSYHDFLCTGRQGRGEGGGLKAVHNTLFQLQKKITALSGPAAICPMLGGPCTVLTVFTQWQSLTPGRQRYLLSCKKRMVY